MTKYDLLYNIQLIKMKLKKSDYITNKLTEALAEYVVYGTNQTVIDMYNEYYEDIQQRKAWREELNRLESELKLYEGV